MRGRVEAEIAVDQDVCRFHVSVDQARARCAASRAPATWPHDSRQCGSSGSSPSLDQLAQIGAVDVAHGDVRHKPSASPASKIGMTFGWSSAPRAATRARTAHERRRSPRARRSATSARPRLRGRYVVRAEHHAHPPAPQHPLDPVRREICADARHVADARRRARGRRIGRLTLMITHRDLLSARSRPGDPLGLGAPSGAKRGSALEVPRRRTAARIRPCARCMLNAEAAS